MSEKHLPQTATQVEGATLACRETGLPATRTALARTAPSADDLARADKVEIEGLEVFANHGVYPEETVLGQKFIVSLTLYANLARAGAKDDLSASIDYGAACHEVDAFLREHTFKLIEAAAEGLAAHILSAHPVLLGVRVRLEKPWAPIGLPLKGVGVEIVRTRG